MFFHKDFWHTYYEDTYFLVFHLIYFSAATLPCETVDT